MNPSVMGSNPAGISCVEWMRMGLRPTMPVTTVVTGIVGRRPIRIHSTHDIPAGFEPITLGFIDLGALLFSTPKRGIDVHVPGLMEIGAPGDVEFGPKAPFPEFALSGP